MIHLRRVHRLDEADIVHDLRRFREEVTDPGPAFAVLFEAGECGESGAGFPLRHRTLPLVPVNTFGNFLAPPFFHLRFVIEHVEVRRRPVHEKIDDPLCFRRIVRKPGNFRKLVGESLPFEKGSERQRADSQAGLSEEMTAGQMGGVVCERVHRGGHSLVSASSRFRIMRQSPVQAACSTASSFPDRFDSPMEISFAASSGVAEY